MFFGGKNEYFGNNNGFGLSDNYGENPEFSTKRADSVFQDLFNQYRSQVDIKFNEIGRNITLICELGKAQAKMCNVLQDELHRAVEEIEQLKEENEEQNKINLALCNQIRNLVSRIEKLEKS